MPKSKKLRYFAGPNGSGKSTLFNSLSKTYNTGCFINADRLQAILTAGNKIDLLGFGVSAENEDLESFLLEKDSESILNKAIKEGVEIKLSIENNFLVDDSKIKNSYSASLIASFLRSFFIKRGLNFSFETVMSHPSKLEEIKKATARGFQVYLYFVCTDDPELNISRIDKRVNEGGHDVPDDRVRSRYENTLRNLAPALRLTHRAYLFDNSGKSPLLIAEIHDNLLTLNSEKLPNWFQNYVLPYYS